MSSHATDLAVYAKIFFFFIVDEKLAEYVLWFCVCASLCVSCKFHYHFFLRTKWREFDQTLVDCVVETKHELVRF